MTAPSQNAIDVRDFSISLAGRRILNSVSFSVRRGEAVTIVGPNGAGKTTLLKCLAGLLSGDSGEIQLDGQPLADYGRKRLARRMSYVPQADSQPVPFTVEQFVLMGRYPYLSPFSPVSREDREVAHQAMAATDTAQFAPRRLDTLSGGERQKVYLAAALAQAAEILLLDEPTTFLDYHHQEDICRLLRRSARSAGLTMISVTHDVNRAALESDRIVALRRGRVVFVGTPREIMRPEVLGEVYGCQFVLVEHPHSGMPMIVPQSPPEDLP
ncbi:MAG: ABC transporter ATP-binding protein [Pirellulales bacterium]|nr:ABC transporter ATP-binding protein [Pirellulales bacterium]